MAIPGWILAGLAVFLIVDAVLATICGEPYMVWGLDYTPEFYRGFITRLMAFPQRTILGIKAAECAGGLFLLWIALKMQR